MFVVHGYIYRTNGYLRQELTVPGSHGTLRYMNEVIESTEELRRRFSLRLNEALDRAGVPPKNEGRQTTLARRLKETTGRSISQKGVRKWLEGEAMPTEENRQALVRICRVSYQWLFGSAGAEAQDYAAIGADGDRRPKPGLPLEVRESQTNVYEISPPLPDRVADLMSALPENISPQVQALIQQILRKSKDGKLSESSVALLISTVTQLSSDKP